MSNPPVAIDPAHILAYLASTTSNYPQDSQFLRTFHCLHPTISTAPSPANSNDSPLRLYIVQQPAPAKHRRSYVEIKDLRALCGRDPATGLAVSVSDASATGGQGTGMSDLKDSVLVMRRIPEAPVLTAETLACLPGSDGSVAGSGTSGSDSMRGDGSSNAGDDTSSSLADDEMTGGNGGHASSGGRMELSKMLLGADHVASWMSNNTLAYLDMCLSMGHSDHSDGSDTASPPPSSDSSPNNAPAQSIPEVCDYESDGGVGDCYDDEGEESNDNEAESEETREGKRPRHSTTITTASDINPHQTLPPWIGIDFKRIMAMKKDKRLSTRRVIR
ncbi:hypothetical protein BG015_000784 [Linnemannia schmuckeri]|uniref:Uncharacterized protein n=1 Tax=Linnemannia schmuckeri TaxID=64567 RepID=A0A9P5S6J9_9FUNG|nr:hypothetical protein BG015_000784 [Linnemannia schmuckeri]